MSEVSNRRFVHFDGTKQEFIDGGYPDQYQESIVFITGSGDNDNSCIYTHNGYYASMPINKGNADNCIVLGDVGNVVEAPNSVAFGESNVIDSDAKIDDTDYGPDISGDLTPGGNFIIGKQNIVTGGRYSFVEGHKNTGNNHYIHAEGYKTIANAYGSHTEGYNTATNVVAKYSHAEGCKCCTNDDYTHAEGYYTFAGNGDGLGKYSHTEGYNSQTWALASHAEGYQTCAGNDSGDGKYSHTEGYGSITNGTGSHAEGYYSKAFGDYSHSEGFKTFAKGEGSHAEGYNSTASGNYSHTEGFKNEAFGNHSHAEGYNSTAFGNYSHAQGRESTAIGNYSFVSGYGLVSSNSYETVVGKFNKELPNQLFAVGCGSSSINRENALSVIGDITNIKNAYIGNCIIDEDIIEITLSGSLYYYMLSTIESYLYGIEINVLPDYIYDVSTYGGDMVVSNDMTISLRIVISQNNDVLHEFYERVCVGDEYDRYIYVHFPSSLCITTEQPFNMYITIDSQDDIVKRYSNKTYRFRCKSIYRQYYLYLNENDNSIPFG